MSHHDEFNSKEEEPSFRKTLPIEKLITETRRTKMYEDQIKQIQAAQGIGLQNYKPLTIREEISGEIHSLKERLQKKEEMLKLLNENPAIEKFMNLSR